MPDIFHSFPVKAPLKDVFESFSTSPGLDKWWTKSSSGKRGLNEIYCLEFGPLFKWSGTVSRFVAGKEFELTITSAQDDWINTQVGVLLTANDDFSGVEFYHRGWPANNEHYRVSCYCWAMYLRILKRYLEYGEEVPYENRLNV